MIKSYLRTEEELEIAEEETERCPECSTRLINCGLDCIYHQRKSETDHKSACRCNNQHLKGTIIALEYCPYKKKSFLDTKEHKWREGMSLYKTLDYLDFE